MAMTRRFNIVLMAALLFIALPCYWLLFDNRPGDPAPKPVEIAELRTLADSMPGDKPVAIALERAAYKLVSGAFLSAGSGLKRRLYSAVAYRLEVPGKGPVVIDPGMTRAAARQLEFDRLIPRAQAAIDAALASASLVLTTSEQPVAASNIRAGAAVLARIAGKEPQAVAPGVVVIPTGAPTPGSRMIYVALADGREYLLAGEVAPLASSFTELRGRPRLMTDHLMPEDRAEAFAWLATIRALQRQAPGLRVLPGHDLAWLASPQRQDWVIKAFPIPAAREQGSGKPSTYPVKGGAKRPQAARNSAGQELP